LQLSAIFYCFYFLASTRIAIFNLKILEIVNRFFLGLLYCAISQHALCQGAATSTPLTPPVKKPYPYGPKPTKSSQTPPQKEPECEGAPPSFRFNLTHREGGGIGYTQGYTSLDGFFAFSCMETFHPFFDVRLHIFNDGRPATNLGFGVRYIPSFDDAVLGINGFFDYRNTKHTTFEQAGIGFEYLTPKWEARLNGYFPIFGRNNLYSLDFYKFEGHQAIFRANHEISFAGYDLSYSHTLLQRGQCDFSAMIDNYMFFASYNSKAIGGFLKLKSNLSPYFSIETQGSYDSYFKGVMQIQAGFNIPFGKRIKTGKKKLSCRKEIALSRRIAQEVDRFEIIVADHHPIDSVARDIRTNKPLYIVFVDNSNVGGDGTAESPYGFLKTAERNSSVGDMIYVYAGTGSNAQQDAGIILKDQQWLQSAFLPFPVSTAFGRSMVPQFSTTRPLITNAVGSTVVLGSGNVISGFTFHSNTTNISGENFQDLQLANNHMSISSSFDVVLVDASGDIVITDNLSLGQSGLSLHTTNDVKLTLEGNDFANTGLQNLDIAFSGSSNSTVLIQNRNEFHDSATGSLIAALNTSTVSINVANNEFTAIPDATPYCLKLLSSNTATTVSTVSNNLFRSSAPGLHLDADLGASAQWFVTNNEGLYTGHDSPMYPFSFTTNGTSTATLLLSGNFAAADGFILTRLNPLSTFYVESPTLSIAGLEALNEGTFTVSPGITYIPYDPSAIPVID
jgi:hypothetical protein